MPPEPPAPGIDTGTPNTARIYDYLLGGTMNYEADRAAARKLIQVNPEVVTLARDNRAFTRRAVRWAASQGIRQFLDLGAGLLTPPATHESARSARPGARVAYVDTDPMVLRQAKAVLRGSPGIAVLGADLRDAGTVLGCPGLRGVIDLDEPVCVLLAAVLGFTDAGTAREACAAYAAAIAPGSVMVISCAYGAGEAGRAIAAPCAPWAGWSHSVADIASFFDGLDLVPPGITDVAQWHPDRPRAVGARSCYVRGGVGGKGLPRRRGRGGGRRGRGDHGLRLVPDDRDRDASRPDHDGSAAAGAMAGGHHDGH